MNRVVVNYTDEQTVGIVNAYKAGIEIDKIATTEGRSVKSIIAKLVSEGVYKAKESAKAARAPTKLELIARIEHDLAIGAGMLGNLEKVDKPTLFVLLAAIEDAQ
jgi:hypothetical protein